MLEKVLYVCPVGIGDTLATLPVLTHFSDKYDLIVVANDLVYPILRKYSFIRCIEMVPNLNNWFNGPDNNALEIMRSLTAKYGIRKCMSPYDYVSFRWAGVLNIGLAEKETRSNQIKGYQRLSVAECYCQSFGIPINNVEKHFVPPIPINHDGKKRIIIYSGSREHLRKIPDGTYSKIAFAASNKFSSTHEIVCILDVSRQHTLPSDAKIIDDTDSEKVMELFSKGADCIISADSGYYWLAKTFKIASIMLESRVRVESLTPHFLLRNSRVYRIKELNCAKNCRAKVENKLFGEEVVPYRHRPFINEVRGYESYYATHIVKNLECFKEKEAPCLSFSDGDICEIMEIISEMT